jgi:hypothetical protein
MTGTNRKKSSAFEVAVMIFLSLLLGCRPMPPKDVVKNLILRDFESRHYKVTELQISDIKPSSGEKIYMSSETYIVYIPLMTLEATQDIGSPVMYKKGQQLSFRNASMGIKEDLYQKGKWIITDIKGIPVP